MHSRTQPPRRWLGAALLLALGLIAGGCASDDSARAPTAAGTTGTTAIRASYAPAPCPTPMYEGYAQLDLGPDFACGYLTVPENRTRPGGRTIRLPIARLRATSPNPKPDPIVYLAGGPGGPPLLAKAPKAWNRDRDVILFGQRGSLKAEPFLSCAEVDAFYTTAVGLSWEDPATAAASATAARACHDRLVRDGVDLSAYNSAENAADVADLRVALGLDTVNLYGLSYGTDLALQTVRDHPEGIRAVVLDSVLPPQQNLVENGWDNAAQSFRAIFAACAAETACAQAYPDLQGTFTRLVNDLSANPRTITVTRGTNGEEVRVVIDGYKLASGVVVAAAQSPGALPKVPSMIQNLATGDGTEAARFLTEAPPLEVMSFGLQFGVLCSEWAARTDPARVLAVGRRVLPGWPDAVLAQTPQVPFVFADCREWDVPRSADHVSVPTTSNIPVLAVGGSFDSATPLSFAEEAVRTLPNARLLVFPGAGHGIAGEFPAACFATVMFSFLDNPAAFDASCVDAVEVPPFAVP